ncbi:alpha/beta hydrolase domain-containing protein [Phenylobacterium sp.]|uniref:alpha/beta hydrolase domain-containing protein n=1 Tax=Phenylobacterium sp. TaxID=1871053 RepID=UPI0035673D84
MVRGKRVWAALFAVMLAGASLGLSAPAQAAVAQPATALIAAPGSPFLGLGTFDLGALGYVVEEYIVSGTATSFKLTGEPTPDGAWTAQAAGTAPYATRIVVVRPKDAKAFNGTVAVEWLNVTGGLDAGPDWTYSHREMLRSGYAYVGVSAQKVGVEGGQSLGGAGMPLKKANPARYGTLSHPGDTFSFDIFSQAGQAVKSGKVLGPLKARHVLATGESQSAVFMTTYVDAIDPLARVYDGFYIHSRFGGAPPPEAAAMRGGPNGRGPSGVKMRADLRVPVMTLISETDLIGSGLSGFWTARQPDNAKLRIWEMPGTAHVDNYMFFVGGFDSGSAPMDKIAPLWKPTDALFGAKMAKPINAAPQHHYVAMAAMSALESWVRTGRAPPKAARLETEAAAKAGEAPKLVPDAQGNSKGGIRTPWVDAPTARLSGFGNTGGPFGFLVGTTEPFDAATLAKLYPGGKADYLAKFDASLAQAVKAGFILKADAPEIRALAAANWPGA